MRKISRIFLALIFAMILGSSMVLADDAGFEDEWNVDVDTPWEVEEYLPFSFDEMDISAIQNAFDFRFFSKTGVKILAEAIPDAAKSFALLLGIFLITAVLHTIKGALMTPTEVLRDLERALMMQTAELPRWTRTFRTPRRL